MGLETAEHMANSTLQGMEQTDVARRLKISQAEISRRKGQAAPVAAAPTVTPPPTIHPTQNNLAVVAAAPDKEAIAVLVEAVPKLKSPTMPPAAPRAPSFTASTNVSLFSPLERSA